MISAPAVMALVALACAIGAALVFMRPTPSEAAIYRNRIAATMLAAGAIILAGFAFALNSWSATS